MVSSYARIRVLVPDTTPPHSIKIANEINPKWRAWPALHFVRATPADSRLHVSGSKFKVNYPVAGAWGSLA